VCRRFAFCVQLTCEDPNGYVRVSFSGLRPPLSAVRGGDSENTVGHRPQVDTAIDFDFAIHSYLFPTINRSQLRSRREVVIRFDRISKTEELCGQIDLKCVKWING
jgi:hypothetical protein